MALLNSDSDVWGWERGIGEADVPISPARSIAITPELQAEDAARQAAREQKAVVGWKLPDPLPPRSYVLPAGRSRGKRRSKKTKEKPLVKTATTPADLADRHFDGRPQQSTSFQIGKPVHESEIPRARKGGPVSPYMPVYVALKDLKPKEFLPVTLAGKKLSYIAAAAVRRIARANKETIIVHRSPDGATLYLRIALAEESAK